MFLSLFLTLPHCLFLSPSHSFTDTHTAEAEAECSCKTPKEQMPEKQVLSLTRACTSLSDREKRRRVGAMLFLHRSSLSLSLSLSLSQQVGKKKKIFFGSRDGMRGEMEQTTPTACGSVCACVCVCVWMSRETCRSLKIVISLFALTHIHTNARRHWDEREGA